MNLSRLWKYLRPSVYWRYISYKARTLKRPVLPSSDRPVVWTGTGACGFLRTYDLLMRSGQTSVYFKSRNKLQNHDVHLYPERELLWERGVNEPERVQAYFKREGVYDHHIAPYTIRYAKEILEHFDGKAIFLCLRSQKSAYSLWLQWGYRNPLVADRTRKNRYPAKFYPDLSVSAKDGKDAVERYIAMYYGLAEELAAAYPGSFRIIDADRFFSDEAYFDSINEPLGLGLVFKSSALDCESGPVTTMLDGGLGNNLFQMAEPIAFCAEYGLPTPQFSTWQMPDFPPYYRNDRFLGGHTGTQEEFASAFPSIGWLPPAPASFDHKFMLNDMFSFEDVHPQREAILKRLGPSESMRRELAQKYPDIAKERTISLHYRTGGLKADTRSFSALDTKWYIKVFAEHFPKDHDCFVFSDNNEAARALIAELEKNTGNTYHLVEESVFASLAMMSMCKNHILSNSTLSFWGAYFDLRQPDGGMTILHPSFETYHSEPHIECRMIPYAQWVRMP
ncbi:MAG TPA: alpha-1,2-fucosyltransferase [Candidatus Paceibacterota bacterium]|nr:alpha-1,2-fucosyltransferase [Candidatus Paceibacterota bacterium]